MKKTLAAVAVLGAFAGSALAADVQLYGVVDTGLRYLSSDMDINAAGQGGAGLVMTVAENHYLSGSHHGTHTYYSAIFRDKWYDISRLIAIGKMAKLKNHAAIPYLVEIHRDKDAVSACSLLAEICAWAKDQGKTL